jgi:hypothetical protein
MDFAQRTAHNEEVFRGVNVRIEEGAELHEVNSPLPFHCECGKSLCLSHIEIPPREYERVYANPHRFFVVPGHEQTDVERVVERHERYLVVEKFGEAATEAEKEDPRAS